MKNGTGEEGQIVLHGVIDSNDLSAFAVRELARFMTENNGKCISFIIDDLLAHVTAMKDAFSGQKLDVMAASLEMNVGPTIGRAMFLISVASALLEERDGEGMQPAQSATKH